MTEPVTDVDPLLAALRYPQDAAQVTRGISAMAAAEPGFASRFAVAVLDAADRAGTESARVRAFRVEAPDPRELELECVRGAHLFSAEGRLMLGWRTRRLGTVDLRFADGAGFALNVEIRLHDRLTDEERQRYRTADEGLIAILAEPAATDDRPLGRNKNWLGTVAWSELGESLPGLSESPGWRWLVETIADELYGFEGGEVADDWRALLDEVRDPLLDLVRSAVRTQAPDLSVNAAAKYAGAITEVPDGGEVCIQVPSRTEGWLFISLSGRTEQPVLRIAWEPLSSTRETRAAIQALRQADPLYELTKHGIAHRRPLDPASPDRLLDELRPDLEALTQAGLLVGAKRRTG